MTAGPALYLFTGTTEVRTDRRPRYRSTGSSVTVSDPVAVTVLGTDQADAERTVAAMLSTPDDTAEGSSVAYIDTHTRLFRWTSAEQAPAGTAEAEQARQELDRTVALLDEARSDARIAQQQADAERELAEQFGRALERVRALHLPAGAPPTCVHCGDAQGTPRRFPCPTIRTLEGEA